MTLIKTSILTALSTVIKVLSGFIINKIMAVYVGPSGLAIVGQLQNFILIVKTMSNGAITQGVIKYTAEYDKSEDKQKIFSTSITISLICSLIISIILFMLSDYFSELILKSSEYSSVFVVFGLTIFLFALNTILMSILNGQKEIKKYVFVNIISSLFSLFFTSLLIWQLNLLGALYALVVNQSVIFFVTLAFVVKSNWFKLEYFKQGIDKDTLYNLSKYSLMAITSALTIPVSHLIVRNYIGENISWDHAGYWQGIWYISTMYLLVITTALSVYYLPKLSSTKDTQLLKKEIIYGYKVIIPIVIILSILVYSLKEYIVLVAFSKDFYPMLELFKWQLIGDIIKVSSWLLGNVVLAKAMVKFYISTEIFFSLSFVLLSIIMIDKFGLIGVTYAYTVNYVMHFLINYIMYQRKFS